MTVTFSKQLLGQTVNAADQKLWFNYQNTPFDQKNLDAFKKSLSGCSQQVQDLFIKAEKAGVALRFNSNGTLHKDTIATLEKLNNKYSGCTTASNLYAKAISAESKALAIETMNETQNTTAKNTNTNATSNNTIKQNMHTTALHMKAGAYKIAAAAANFFNSVMVKSIVSTMAITAIITVAIKLFKKLYDTIPTKNHVKEWAEESTTALKETRDEISSLQDEIASLGERIDELQSKGSLTLTEQDELSNLKKENSELEKKLAILKLVEEENARTASKDNLAALSTMNNGSDNQLYYGGYDWMDMSSIDKQIDNYTRMYNSAKKELAALETKGLDSEEAKKQWEEKNKQVTKYRDKLTELTQEASGYIAEIDPKFLSGSDLELYENTLSSINKSLYETGSIDFDTYVSTLFDTDKEVKELNADMKILAASNEEINNNTVEEFVSDEALAKLKEAGFTMAQIVEHIKALRGIEGTIANIIDGIAGTDEGKAEDISGYIDLIVNNEDFDNFDKDAITRIFGKDFINKLKDAGYSMTDFINYLKQAQSEASDIDFSDALTELDGINGAIENINDAYDQFEEDGYVDSDKLAKIAEDFSAINDSDAYKNFITTISDSSSTIEEVGNAMEDLVNTYMTSNEVMSNLTENNRDLYESRLESMGVTNANEIVEYNLQKAILGSATATEKAKKAAADNMAALMEEEWALEAVGVAALDSSTKMQLFAAYEQYAAGNNFADVVNNHATALYNVASAAGPAATALAEYAEIALTMAEITDMLDPESSNYVGNQPGVKNLLKQQLVHYKEEVLPSLAEDAQEQFIDLATPDIDFTPGTTNTDDDSDDDDDPADERKDKYDAEKDKLDYKLEQNLISYTKYYDELSELGEKYLKGQEGNEQDYRDHLTELSDAREEAYENDVANLDRQLAKGLITNEEYLNRLNKARKEWFVNDKTNKVRNGNQDANKDALQDIADKQSDFYDDEKEKLDESLDNGKISWSTYYKKITDLQKYYLSKSKYNSEKYLEEQEAIADQALDYWENEFTKTEDKIDRYTLTDTWAPDENAINLWDKLYKRIRNAYINGEIDWETYNELYYQYLEKRNDAEDEYYENNKQHLEDLTDMVADMLRQEAEDMIDALEEQRDSYADIVEEKKKALELTRKQLNYEKELNEDSEELSELQAQAALYATDTTREGQAKYAQIMEEIAEKQGDIVDKQSENAYDATNDALDAANEAFQESIQDKIDEINENLNHQGKCMEAVYAFLTNSTVEEVRTKLRAYNYEHGDGKNSTVDTIIDNTASSIAAGTVEKDLNRANNETESDDGTPSDNYKTKEEVIKLAYAKTTRKNTDKANLALTEEIQRHFPNAYYDPTDKVWYTNENKKRTVAASSIISQMETIAENKKLSKAKKKNQIAPLLTKLKTYWGYANAHMDYTNMHLYKTKGKKVKVFHSGLSGGFVGEGYTPSQKESYTLLTNDELVLNKNDQFRLANQIQVWDSVKKALGGLVEYVGMAGGTSSSPITIIVEAPVNISGNADANTAKELERFGKKIADETLSKLQSAMGQRGYSSRVSQSAMKKL